MRSSTAESLRLQPSEICAYFDVPHPGARAGAASRAKLAARSPVLKPSARLQQLERDRELRLAMQWRDARAAAVAATTPVQASQTGTDGHRSAPMSDWLREIPFLLRTARRLDEFLRLHEADQAAVAVSIEQHLKSQARQPEQM